MRNNGGRRPGSRAALRSGEFEISLVTGEVFRLKAGDSLTFRGQEEAGWRNPSRTRSTELLWVITPSLF
jgi:hypothetical protein